MATTTKLFLGSCFFFHVVVVVVVVVVEIGLQSFVVGVCVCFFTHKCINHLILYIFRLLLICLSVFTFFLFFTQYFCCCILLFCAWTISVRLERVMRRLCRFCLFDCFCSVNWVFQFEQYDNNNNNKNISLLITTKINDVMFIKLKFLFLKQL